MNRITFAGTTGQREYLHADTAARRLAPATCTGAPLVLPPDARIYDIARAAAARGQRLLARRGALVLVPLQAPA